MGVDVHKSTDRCPICNSPIEQRKDDRPKAIAKRLLIFHRQTQPVIRYFRSLGLLRRVSGKKTIPAVFRLIDKVYQEGVYGQRAAARR